MHLRQPSCFYDFTHSTKLRQLVQHDLGWTQPVVPQSMYIFKPAQMGGVVHSHQDSTFLFTTPQQSCLGLWLALDDATLDNGCLWVRPQSHVEPVRRHYQRNPQHFETATTTTDTTGSSNTGTATPPNENDKDTRDDDDDDDENKKNEKKNTTGPKFIMKDLETNHPITWDGALPNDENDFIRAGFIPVECQAGDLLAFCGQLDHLSLPNTSNQARHTFQLHLVSATQEWSPHNWLQYPKGKEFVAL